MKALFLCFMLFASLSAQAMIEPVGRSTTLNFDGTPDTRTLEKHFINVIAGGAYAIGTVVTADLTAKDGATVATSATSGLSPLCIISPVACVSGKICKCQKYGLMSSGKFDSTMANAVAGARFYMSTNNAGYISGRGTSVATEIPGGIFYDSASASGAVKIFINL